MKWVPKGLKWCCTQMLLPLVIGVTASVGATWLTFDWFKQGFLSTIEKGLEILRFDDALAELEKASAYSLDREQFRQAAGNAGGADLDQQKARLQQIEGALSEASARLGELLKAYDKLPIEDKPVKLYDDNLITGVRRIFRSDLEALRSQIAATGSSIKTAASSVDSVKDAIGSKDKRMLVDAEAQLARLLGQIDRARLTLVERRDAMRRSLSEFGKN